MEYGAIFFSARRQDLDGKYDDRNSGLIFVFARCLILNFSLRHNCCLKYRSID
ncbi:MAG: hypothetical protein ACRC2R_25570 [Xenococcaceae cyanobacterium]